MWESVLCGRFDNVEAAVFACVEATACQRTVYTKASGDALFLCALYVQQHAVEPKDALLERARLLGDLGRARGRLATGLALDHDVEVDEFLGEGAHVVLEAEGVLSWCVSGEDIVALAFALAVEQDLVIGVADLEVDVEGATGLHLGGCERGTGERGEAARTAK